MAGWRSCPRRAPLRSMAYGFAVLASTAMCATRPAQSAVLPSTARVAQELTAANVIGGWAENFGIVVSAAIAAIFLDIGRIGLLFALCAAFDVIAAILVAPVRASGIALADETDEEPGVTVSSRVSPWSPRQDRARLLTGLLTASRSSSGRSTYCSSCWSSACFTGARHGLATSMPSTGSDPWLRASLRPICWAGGSAKLSGHQFLSLVLPWSSRLSSMPSP